MILPVEMKFTSKLELYDTVLSLYLTLNQISINKTDKTIMTCYLMYGVTKESKKIAKKLAGVSLNRVYIGNMKLTKLGLLSITEGSKDTALSYAMERFISYVRETNKPVIAFQLSYVD